MTVCIIPFLIYLFAKCIVVYCMALTKHQAYLANTVLILVACGVLTTYVVCVVNYQNTHPDGYLGIITGLGGIAVFIIIPFAIGMFKEDKKLCSSVLCLLLMVSGTVFFWSAYNAFQHQHTWAVDVLYFLGAIGTTVVMCALLYVPIMDCSRTPDWKYLESDV